MRSDSVIITYVCPYDERENMNILFYNESKYAARLFVCYEGREKWCMTILINNAIATLPILRY